MKRDEFVRQLSEGVVFISPYSRDKFMITKNSVLGEASISKCKRMEPNGEWSIEDGYSPWFYHNREFATIVSATPSTPTIITNYRIW